MCKGCRRERVDEYVSVIVTIVRLWCFCGPTCYCYEQISVICVSHWEFPRILSADAPHLCKVWAVCLYHIWQWSGFYYSQREQQTAKVLCLKSLMLNNHCQSPDKLIKKCLYLFRYSIRHCVCNCIILPVLI